jgi:hypothetical protein
MFKSISWQEYLMAVGLLTAGYYIIVISVFYSRDVLLKLKGQAVSNNKPTQAATVDRGNTLMGAISNPPRKKIPIKQSVLEAEELTFESDPEEMLLAQRADSPAAELIETLDDLFITLSIKRAQRSEYVINIRKLFQSYGEFKGSPARQDIYSFIQDNFKTGELTISTEELDTLWLDGKAEDIHKSTTKNNYEK